MDSPRSPDYTGIVPGPSAPATCRRVNGVAAHAPRDPQDPRGALSLRHLPPRGRWKERKEKGCSRALLNSLSPFARSVRAPELPIPQLLRHFLQQPSLVRRQAGEPLLGNLVEDEIEVVGLLGGG